QHFTVTEARETLQLQFAADDRLRQVQQVSRLLPRHAEPAQVVFAEIEKTFRRKRLDRSVESREHRFRGTQRYLLFENDLYERGEAGGAAPQRWIAVDGVNVCEKRIARGKFARRQRQSF